MRQMEWRDFSGENRFLLLVYTLFLSFCVERAFILTEILVYVIVGTQLAVSGVIRFFIFIVMVWFLVSISIRLKCLLKICQYVGSQEECLWFLGNLAWTNFFGMAIDRWIVKYFDKSYIGMFLYLFLVLAYSYLLYIFVRKASEKYRQWKKVHGGDDWNH